MGKIIRYFLLLLSLFLFLLGKSLNSFNIELLGIFYLWVMNIVYCFEDIRDRIYLLFFNITFFGFLMSRPVISLLKGEKWWYFTEASVNFALNSLILSLIFIFIGYVICESRREKYNKNLELIKKSKSKDICYLDYISNSKFIYNLRIVALVLFYFSVIFFFIDEVDKLMFMRSKSYIDFYTSFKTSLPYLFLVLGSMNKYFLCIFLSTMPKKSLTFFPLALYIISAVPALLIGIRNPIVLNIIFVFLYYFTRDTINYKYEIYKGKKRIFKKWLGKVEWTFIIATFPVLMVLLGLYNYIRDRAMVTYSGIFSIIVDLFYKQGVSFDVLCIGYETIPKIKYTGFTNYTFGGIIDYIFHSKLAQVLWGMESLGEGNNLNKALYSNNFAHRMSYTARGQEYLNGHGWGSSYLLETYADFGYIGIILFSLILGILFFYIIRMINKGSIQSVLSLIILTEIYFCPRDAALGWLNFIIYMQFIVPFVVCYFGACLCIKEYCRKNHILLRM